MDIIRATASDDIAQVKALFLDYLRFIEAYLGQSLAFQGTDTEFADFPQTYDALWLARLDGRAVGAVGLKPFGPDTAELKRLWVARDARGHGIGDALCRACIAGARQAGYRRLLLDTDRGLDRANAIYDRLGFTDVPRYYDNPMDSRFMALDL
ncbi:GNAT family N-acetyltransferase [uncultured Algimonas sp.]|uniref:GNAT family N-acetyltransferase n=1 Tax=uncultured Algimonas sp. TaxID=1547920 RepID=UPI00262AB524|nr:GNAT family N-acetyltransferase [uncultured Algimonas sp.]